jgi:SOS-response transcriptional repressor LexA
MVNIRRPSISDWKKNGSYPYADIAVKIAKILNTTVEYLVTGTPPEGVPHDILDIARKIASLDGQDRAEILALINIKLAKYAPPPLEAREPEPEYRHGPPALDISPYRPPADIQEYPAGDLVLLPFYGEVAAGRPIEINPFTDQTFPFPIPLLRGSPKSYFIVRLRGTSMTEAGLNDGDLAVIREAGEPVNGKIMLVRYENSSTLKRIRAEGETIYLCWEDGSGEVREIDSGDYQVQGEFFRKLEG